MSFRPVHFRDRASLVSAVMTGALLTGMEVSDMCRGTRPDDTVDDHGTAGWFGAAMGTAIATSLVALGRDRHEPVPRRPRRWWTGLALIWSGAAFNRWARAELGKNYRSQLTIVHGHEVIDSGPYRLVRHPMYTGAALICIGCAFVVDRWAPSVTWALPATSLVHRVRVEEQLLRSVLGHRYEDFADTRPRLIPGVW